MIAAIQRAAALLALAAVLAGCAVPLKPDDPANPQAGPWSGRLALQVQDQPDQSFSAGFELRGQASAGELMLFTPLGGTAAQLKWTPGAAMLTTGGQTRQFESLEALVLQATGSPIPVAALFDWLAARNTPVEGWEADLTQLPQGRLFARRIAPPPLADLRVALDR